jgi:hypothetical protein
MVMVVLGKDYYEGQDISQKKMKSILAGDLKFLKQLKNTFRDCRFRLKNPDGEIYEFDERGGNSVCL